MTLQVKVLTALVTFLVIGVVTIGGFAFKDVYSKANTNQTNIATLQNTLAGYEQKVKDSERRINDLESENKELSAELSKVRERVLVIETNNSSK